MKKLNNYGVSEMTAKEIKSIEGGCIICWFGGVVVGYFTHGHAPDGEGTSSIYTDMHGNCIPPA